MAGDMDISMLNITNVAKTGGVTVGQNSLSHRQEPTKAPAGLSNSGVPPRCGPCKSQPSHQLDTGTL